MPYHITPQFLAEIDTAIATYWYKRNQITKQEHEDYLKSKKITGRALLLAQETHNTILSQANRIPSTDKLADAIAAIEYELEHWDGLSFGLKHYRDTRSPRIQFLLKMHEELKSIQKNIELNIRKSSDREATDKISGEKRSILRIAFDIFKKLADSLDDFWQMIASALNNQALRDLVSSFLQGGVGIIIFIAEAFQGLKEAHHAFIANETLGQRKTRAFTGLLICALGLVGAGLSATFLASAFGALVAGLNLLPVLLPVILASIYVVKLAKTTYVLIQSINLEKDHQVKLLDAKIKLVELSKKRKPSNADDAIFLNAQESIQLLTQSYLFARNERLNAERQVAFKSLEVGTNIFVLAGVFLALAAATGAVSFGIIPTIVIATGVVIAFTVQIFDYYDERKKNEPTRKIRSNIINSWGKMTDVMRKTFKPNPTDILVEMQLVAPLPAQSAFPELPNIEIIRKRDFSLTKSMRLSL